jgi:hypothetical protein
MSKPRFSLKTVLGVVTLAAVGCAALANPTELWASVVFSATLLVFFCATVAAFSRRAAIPFAVFGWGYLALILWPGSETNILPNLVTSKLLVYVEELHHIEDAVMISAGDNPFAYWSTGPEFRTDWEGSPFIRIGHSLFALSFATVGGMVAGWLSSRRDRSHAG